MCRFEGKTAIITGAASGIGAATARLFVNEGANVLATDINDARGQHLADALGDTAQYRHVDVSQEHEVRDAVDAAVETWGQLDCLFNNAGTTGGGAHVDTIPEGDFDRILSVNLKGTFFGVKHAARVMKPQRSGSIINNASVSGLMNTFSSLAYSTSKAAIIHMTRVAAAKLGEHGLRVNCVCPGLILTPIYTHGAEMSDGMQQELSELFSQQQPIQRAGLPEDVAQAVLWLASDEASFVTGHPLVVDGGVSLGFSASFLQAFTTRLNTIRQRD